MRRLLPALLLWLHGTVALAQETPGATAPRISSVQALADAVVAQVGHVIGDLPRPRLDLAFAMRDGLPPASGSARPSLAAELRQLLLGTLLRSQPLRSVRDETETMGDDEEEARRRAAGMGYELFLWLDLRVEANHIVLDGWLYDVERNIWRDTVEPERRVLGRIHARRRVDAELRRFLPPVPAGALRQVLLPLGAGPYLAATIADLDGDDVPELALLRPWVLEIRQLRRDELVTLAREELVGLPRAAVRSRDPLGVLVVGPRRADGLRPLALRTTEHARGLIVTFDGERIERVSTLEHYPIRWSPLLQCAEVEPGHSAFVRTPFACDADDQGPSSAPFYGVARRWVRQRDGSDIRLEATLLAEGALVLRWNDRDLEPITPVGAALAVTDVDDDGVVEVLVSSDSPPGPVDEVWVYRVGSDGVVGRERVEVPGAVWVASSGDVDGDGFRELIAVAQGQEEATLLVLSHRGGS